MTTETLRFDLEGARVWVAGHRGMVGSAVVRRLGGEPISEVITADSRQLDLTRQAEAEEFVRTTSPDVAIIAAAKVGGINANRRAQADFLYENLMISANSLRASQLAGVKKTVLLGSSCIYPREAPQPIPEDAFLTGPLEETNEGYAIAKIAALEYGRMLRRQYDMDVISLMPTNLYGPGDNYDLESSHVLPALLGKVHDAKTADQSHVQVWGSGRPRREFLHVDDLADAVVFAVREISEEEHLNVGTGVDISILDLATTIAEIVGWHGEFVLDASMPDGTPRKLLDVSKLAEIGWKASIDLHSGLESTYRAFLQESTRRTSDRP